MPIINGNDGNNPIADTIADDEIFAGDGNDTISVTEGRDIVHAGNDEDTLIIQWDDVSLDIEVFNSSSHYGQVDRSVDFDAAARNVDFFLREVEHIDLRAGSGDDYFFATFNRWDRFDGALGTDTWVDSFGASTAPVSVDMAQISSDAGQTFADGTVIRNVEIAMLTLTPGDDSFADAGAFNDSVNAGAGDDTLRSSDGQDTMRGGSGDDTLIIDWGDALPDIEVFNSSSHYGQVDRSVDFDAAARNVDFFLRDIEHIDLRAGAGDDYFHATASRWDKFDGGMGTDTWVDSFSGSTDPISVVMADVASGDGQTFADGTVIRNVEIAMLTLTPGDDSFADAGAFNDSVNAGAGDDTLRSSDGQDTMRGGSGDDTLIIDWGDALPDIEVFNSSSHYGQVDRSVDFDAAAHNVDFDGIEHIDLRAGAGDDYFHATANRWDKFDGGMGTDTWVDSFSASTASISVAMANVASEDGQAFNDGTVIRNVEVVRLTLGAGNDRFTDAGAFDDSVSAGDGDDTLSSSGGQDTMRGGAGEDTLIIDWSGIVTGASVFNTRSARAQSDSTVDFADAAHNVDFDGIEHIDARLGSGDDTVRLGSGDDTVLGGGGDDTLRSGGGDDRLSGGGGNNSLYGGDGMDTAVFTAALADVSVTEEAGVITLRSPSGTTLIEEVEHFAFADQTLTTAELLAAFPGAINLTGTPGQDTLSGGAGDDTITGLGGNDRIVGEGGDDTLEGGDGADTINGGDGDDLIRGGATEADRRDVIYGGAGDDSIDAGHGNDLVYGQGGNDTIAGGFGADELQGQDGDDVITGSAFGDIVFGNAGDDFVNGGFGHDLINGGTGADKFFHTGGTAAQMEGHGSDWVQDYSAAEGDVLVFGGSARADQFQVNLTHTANKTTGERSGDDDVQEAFVIYKPTGQILWALVDGGGQAQINLQIGGEVFDLLA